MTKTTWLPEGIGGRALGGKPRLTDLLQVGDPFVELSAEFGPFSEFVLRRGLGEFGLVGQDLFPQRALFGRRATEEDAGVRSERLEGVSRGLEVGGWVCEWLTDEFLEDCFTNP